MIIDPIDLRIIRELELHGSVSVNEITGKFNISDEEVLSRIKNFEDSGFITNYGLKLSIPTITGGRWSWGCASIEAEPDVKPEKKIALLEESIENLSFPSGVAPNLSLIFYSRDLKDSYRTINKIPGIKYSEIYKIKEYNILMPRVLIKEDWRAIAELLNSKLRYANIHSILFAPVLETDIKLSRLMWHKRNRQGIISIFPNFNWCVIKNFLHLHLAVVTSLRIKELGRIINSLGFSANITSRFKKRYLQLEFDIWGFGDFQTIIEALKDIKRLSVEGCSFAYKNKIYDEWIKEFIGTKV